MTVEEQRVLQQVASDLYELARVKRGDTDGTFVEVRRTFLAAIAARVMRLMPAK